MPKVHMVASESPIEFKDGIYARAFCGTDVPNARPIFTLNLDNREMDGASTIAFCKKCLGLALLPLDRKTYVYGITEGQVALDANED